MSEFELEPEGASIALEFPEGFLGDATRAAFPRQLIIYEEKENSWDPCTDEDILASTEYLAVSYRQADFPDKVKLEEIIRDICHFLTLKAYWLDYACTGDTQAEKNRDLYRIADVFRGASKTLVLISGDDDRPLSDGWRRWGDRIWTLPEALLSQELIYKVGSRPLKKTSLRMLANLAYKDRQEEMIIIDGYSGKEPLSLKERLTLLRRAIWKRSSGPDKKVATGGMFAAYPAERVYALMGLMPHRIMPESAESEEMAYSRLLEANGLDDHSLSTDQVRTLYRPKTPNFGVSEIEELSTKLESQSLIESDSLSSVTISISPPQDAGTSRSRTSTPSSNPFDIAYNAHPSFETKPKGQPVSRSRSTGKTPPPPLPPRKKSNIKSVPDQGKGKGISTFSERNDLNPFNTPAESEPHVSGEHSGLDFEIAEARDNAADYPYEHPDKPKLLCGLAQLLNRRFREAHNLQDLDEALIHTRASLFLLHYIHKDSPDKPALITLALLCFKSRYPRINTNGDLVDAIPIIQEDINAVNVEDPYSASYLNDLACCVMARFWNTMNFQLINTLIELLKSSLTIVSDADPSKAAYCYFLGLTFYIRHTFLRQITDVDQAIFYLRISVDISHNDFPEKSEHLNTLDEVYYQYFLYDKDEAKLDEAIECAEESIRLTPADSISLAIRRADLCIFRRLKFEITNDESDLEFSVINGQEAIRLAEDNYPNKPTYLHEYALTLVKRAGSEEDDAAEKDIKAAISMEEKAIQLCDLFPGGQEKKCIYAAVLSVLYRVRYELTRNSNDLDMSIIMGNTAVGISDNMAKCTAFAELGISLALRAQLSGKVGEAQCAIEFLDMGIAALPDTNDRKRDFLYMQGTVLVYRYEKLSNPGDIDLAIQYVESGLRLLPERHADKSKFSTMLSELYQRRYSISGNSLDYYQAVAYEAVDK